MQTIHGNTYAVREQIKALGGKWNPAAKCWMVPDDQANAARALVSGTRAAPTKTTLRCKCCGTTGTRGAYPFSTLPGSGRCDDCV